MNSHQRKKRRDGESQESIRTLGNTSRSARQDEPEPVDGAGPLTAADYHLAARKAALEDRDLIRSWEFEAAALEMEERERKALKGGKGRTP